LAALTKRKGIFTLIDAFDRVAAAVPGVRLLIAGDGHERPEVEAAAARSAYRERITFLGPVPRDRVAATFAQSTLLCLPSFVEPYGMPIVEAMASGRAVIATAAGGPIDLVDPRGGTLVPPNDAPALAAALTAVLMTPGLAQRMGAFNRQAVAAYRWPAVIDRLEAVYDSVARRRFTASEVAPPRAAPLPPGASSSHGKS
jgi:glycosyltransferase involved in cell wall biosynthesis